MSIDIERLRRDMALMDGPSCPDRWKAETRMAEGACKVAATYLAAVEENARLRKGLKDVIGMLDDPTGGEHVRDMRGATIIARAALGGGE